MNPTTSPSSSSQNNNTAHTAGPGPSHCCSSTYARNATTTTTIINKTSEKQQSGALPFTRFAALQQTRNDSHFFSSSKSIASQRLYSELKELAKFPVPNCHAYPTNDTIFRWSIVLDGPKNTLYENGTFFAEMNFSVNYPFTPPEVVFLTKIYHCNINGQGEVCLGLKNKWRSNMGITTILQMLISLLCSCDPYTPLVPALAEKFLFHREEYEQMARIWTQRYAC